MPNNDVVLVAQWEKNSNPGGTTKYYDVIYHPNTDLGEDNVIDGHHKAKDTIEVEEGDIFTAPAGKKFAGWSETPDGTMIYSGKEWFSMPSHDVHLYAIWIGDDFPTLNYNDHDAYIIGYPIGDVRPENNISREEVAAIFFRLLSEESRNFYWDETEYFDDVQTGRWSHISISTLVNAGILEGRDGDNFAPAAPITRAEFATIAARFNENETTEESGFSDIYGHWASSYIDKAAELGWVNGYTDGTFKPNQAIVRSEAMTLVNNVLNRHVNTTDDLLDDMIKWPDNSNTEAWYYFNVQEATNSHDYIRKDGTVFENWTEITEVKDWARIERGYIHE